MQRRHAITTASSRPALMTNPVCDEVRAPNWNASRRLAATPTTPPGIFRTLKDDGLRRVRLLAVQALQVAGAPPAGMGISAANAAADAPPRAGPPGPQFQIPAACQSAALSGRAASPAGPTLLAIAALPTVFHPYVFRS